MYTKRVHKRMQKYSQSLYRWKGTVNTAGNVNKGLHVNNEQTYSALVKVNPKREKKTRTKQNVASNVLKAGN